jgi:hypothetical protein
METTEKGVCRLAVVPMRKDPSDQSELVNQVLFGEHYEVLQWSENDKWIRLRLHFDGYEGWIDAKQHHYITEEYFQQIQRSEYKINTDILADIYFQGIHLHIPMGSIIPITTHELFKIEESISYSGNAKSLGQKKDAEYLISLAQKYLHTPYCWGGKTPFGIDCSGFTQQVFKICGYRLYRDAWQQVSQGQEIGDRDQIQPGDLVFFDVQDGRPKHVGIALPNDKIIHASGKVKIDKLDEKGIFDLSKNKYTHSFFSIRRVLKYTHGQ